jgi:hypothetical protein
VTVSAAADDLSELLALAVVKAEASAAFLKVTAGQARRGLR